MTLDTANKNTVIACIVGLTFIGIVVQIDTLRTNRELRDAADDIRRANGYLVRAAAQRKRRWWRR